MGKTKIKLLTDIASSEGWAFQRNQVTQVDSLLAEKWISSGVAEKVSASTPLTKFDELDGLRDLSIAEAQLRTCVHCGLRATRVLGNRPLCTRHFRSELEG